MSNHHRNVLYFTIITFLVFSGFACTKKNPADEAAIQLQTNAKQAEAELSKIAETTPVPFSDASQDIPKWLPGENRKIVLLFGHGYSQWENKTAEQAALMQILQAEFGPYSEGGLIEAMEFPKEYFTGKLASVSFISSALKNQNAQALIVLNAPDRTHYALANLQDSLDVPVYSIFSQDDVLGTEAGSTFVLDYQTIGETQGFEEVASFSGDMSAVLVPLIKAIKKSDSADFVTEFQAKLNEHTAGFHVIQYTDPESGLKSKNHYVLKMEAQ